jgi:hypothetical protein
MRSVEFVRAPHCPGLSGTLQLLGDWGNASTTAVTLPPTGAKEVVTTVHAVLEAAVPAVGLWWPLHYGEPTLHTLTARVRWGAAGAAGAGASVTTKIGFRSVELYTGPAAPASPARVDAAHADAFVGCFRDGNPYWGGNQHALPQLAADDANMTVGRCICIRLCRRLSGEFLSVERGVFVS